MSKASNTFRGELLDLLFKNTAIAGIGDAGGLQPSAAAGNYYIRLCTDAVTVDKDTIGTECAYTGYVAGGVAVERSAAGFSRTGNEISNAAATEFGACTAGSENIKYAELWRNNTGNTEADRIEWMEFSQVIAVSAGKTPRFAAGALKFTVV
jgi:hypothetical protein